MKPDHDPVELADQLNELLQQAHFDARGLQQYAASPNGTLPDQLHRIRILAMKLRTALERQAATA
jgi:hypothetical protein